MPRTRKPASRTPSRCRRGSSAIAAADARLRRVFALARTDPIPEVDEASLLRFHDYLAAQLSVPFEAVWDHEAEPLKQKSDPITVRGLRSPRDDSGIDEMYGLFCEARLRRRTIEVPLAELAMNKAGLNHLLVDDYTYWFWNWR